jgi:hypothetical protein
MMTRSNPHTLLFIRELPLHLVYLVVDNPVSPSAFAAGSFQRSPEEIVDDRIELHW